MDQFTPRVLARASLCASPRGRHLPTAIAAGPNEADLTAIADLGAVGAKADAEQQEQIASASVSRTDRKDQKDALFSREDALRDRLIAVEGEVVQVAHVSPDKLPIARCHDSFGSLRLYDLPTSSYPVERDAPVRPTTYVQR